MQPTGLWPAVLGEIELSISRGNFMTWFKPTQLLKCDTDSVVIGVPNVFIKQQLERKYSPLIKETLAKNGVSTAKIEYKIHTAPVKKTPDDPAQLGGGNGGETASPPVSSDPQRQPAGSHPQSAFAMSTPPARPSPPVPAPNTTPSSCTAASVSAKPTSCKPSGMP